MFEQVRDIIVKELEIDPSEILPQTNIKKDLKADSGTILGIIFTLEDELDVTLPDDLGDKVNTIDDLVKLVEASKN